MIVNAVFSSIKIEGSFTSKKALSQHYDSLNKISKGMYESLVKTDEPGFIINSISKTRYYFSHDNHMFEIDVFDNSKHGLLILIEVEFEKDDVVVIPDYLKNLPGFREVTNDPQYFNCNLV